MKLVLLFAILSFSAFNTVNATDADINGTDYASYCDEQAQLAGIENPTEINEYIKECIESFDMPVENALPQDNG